MFIAFAVKHYIFAISFSRANLLVLVPVTTKLLPAVTLMFVYTELTSKFPQSKTI